jgi:hypothetical protein
MGEAPARQPLAELADRKAMARRLEAGEILDQALGPELLPPAEPGPGGIAIRLDEQEDAVEPCREGPKQGASVGPGGEDPQVPALEG